MKYINGPYNGKSVRPFFYMRLEEVKSGDCGVYERNSMRVDFIWKAFTNMEMVKAYLIEKQENLYISG